LNKVDGKTINAESEQETLGTVAKDTDQEEAVQEKPTKTLSSLKIMSSIGEK